uniref:DUF4283 domain-containing protein n=1 Tax=Quercus lobata TaxID=97700 RepID=A0A7N2KXD6_QUELO
MATSVSIIAAKFLTKRALNPNAVVATFTPIWQSKRGFKINNLGTHIILFTFDSESKVDTILANTTWSFDKHLMILKKYDGVSKIEDLDFNSTLFWIQLHGLPGKFMTTTMVENLCKLAGQIESEGSITDVDKEYGAWLKASPWFGARNSVVEVPGFYSKKKEERLGQQWSDETGSSTTARVKQATLAANMTRDTYGNSPSDSFKFDSFQNNTYSAFMSTDPFHIENNTASPTHLHTDPGLFYTSNITFDKKLESIDHDLIKFDNPMHDMSLTTVQPSHMQP